MTQKIIHKILIVEDDRKRAEAFESWMPEGYRAVIVKSAGTALGLLERDKDHVYAGICLDHDLRQQVAVASDHDLSGTTVIKAVIRFISADVPILIHSRNEKRSRYMENKLSDANFYVTRIPMDVLTEERFHEWLDEVDEIWEEFHEE